MLYDHFYQNGGMMRFGLRVTDDKVDDSPFILIVDTIKLKDVVIHLTKIS